MIIPTRQRFVRSCFTIYLTNNIQIESANKKKQKQRGGAKNQK